jgi:hypothetical protein
MKIFYLVTLVTLVPMVFVASSFGANYYMRADGTAANKAAATGPCTSASNTMNIAAHNSQTFSAGDVITLCDNGGVFRGTLIVPSSGLSESNRITYNAGGTPIISGADVYTSYRWKASRISNEWYLESSGGGKPDITEPEMIWVDGIDYRKANPGSLTPGKWGWGNNDSLGFDTLYVYAASGGVTIEGSQRAACIEMNTKNYITIDGLTLRRAGNAAHTQKGLLYIRLGGHHIVQNCHIHDSAWFHLIQIDRSSNNIIQNNDLHTVLDSHETWFYGCAISTDAVVGTTPDNCVVQNNTISDIRANDGAGGYYGAGINVQGAYSVGVNDGPKNWIIQDNSITGLNGNAIYFRRGVTNSIIRRNYIANIPGEGIQIRQGNTNNQIYNNIIMNVLGPGIQLDGKNPSTENPAQDGNKVWNNTIVNWKGSSYGEVCNAIHIIGTNKNSEVKNNLIVSHNGDCLKIDNNSLTGTTSNYNRFYKTGNGVYLMLGTTNYTSLASWQSGTTSGGKKQDDNSSEGNPVIVSLTPSSEIDVNLTLSSPCIDTGIYDPGSGAFSTDYSGNFRPQGAAWDIGAYEYSKTTPLINPPKNLRIVTP